MEDRRVPLQFQRNEDAPNTDVGRRRLQQPTEERGPYETSYNITLGYPERDVVTE